MASAKIRKVFTTFKSIWKQMITFVVRQSRYWESPALWWQRSQLRGWPHCSEKEAMQRTIKRWIKHYDLYSYLYSELINTLNPVHTQFLSLDKTAKSLICWWKILHTYDIIQSHVSTNVQKNYTEATDVDTTATVQVVILGGY